MTQKKNTKSTRKSVSIETESATFRKRRYKILEIRFKPTTRVINRKVAVELWQQVMKMGDPQLILFDARSNEHLWRLDGLSGLSEAQRDDMSIAVLSTKAQRTEANEFIIELMRDYFTLQAFHIEKQALAWLREEGKRYQSAKTR